MENLGKPVVAAVNGFALGGGCETAMACTIRLASEKAKFGQPEVALGVLPGGGGTQRLPRLVGKGRALQLILSGEMISAQEAHRIGLVNEVVPAVELITRAEAILKKIFSNAPLAVKYSLEAVNRGLQTSQSEGRTLEASLFGLCAGTDDKQEGEPGFLAERTPPVRKALKTPYNSPPSENRIFYSPHHPGSGKTGPKGRNPGFRHPPLLGRVGPHEVHAHRGQPARHSRSRHWRPRDGDVALCGN